ncbi:hypothetical protein, partial [Phocaeicola dorei]|uniref:hypothetical protein n=1 Tax=Phocaeicola dorei TaxID=357276 RepID=UPI0032EC5AD4
MTKVGGVESKSAKMPNLHPTGSIYHFFRWLQFAFSVSIIVNVLPNQPREKIGLGRQAMITKTSSN